MFRQLAADAVVILHLAFIVFAVAGGLLVLKWPRLAWLHVPAMLWAAAIEFLGWVCPLTPLEKQLRGAADAYGGGFIEHYLLPFIYPSGLTRQVQILLGLTVVAVNLIVYYVVARRRRPARRHARGSE